MMVIRPSTTFSGAVLRVMRALMRFLESEEPSMSPRQSCELIFVSLCLEVRFLLGSCLVGLSLAMAFIVEGS